MNYRHQFHAGNFADVMKHALVVRLVRAMQRKEKGFLFVDTHAGRGVYDLQAASSGTTLARTPEWPDGIGRLWKRESLPPPVQDYLDVVARFDSDQGNTGPIPRFYPGSPLIVRALLRPQDRLALFELHPEERDALAQALVFERVRIESQSGYGASAALFPPPERRGLMLIDPPFEDQNEWGAIARCVQTALERFASAVIAIWYPVAERADRGSFMSHWTGATLPPTLSAELIVDPLATRMRGCGLLIFNPPWGFDHEARTILDCLRETLAKSEKATGSVVWEIPETP